MTWEDWAPMGAFLLAAQITPGPNNTLFMTAGAARRLRPALAMIIGVGSALMALQFAIALGLGAALEAAPILKPAMAVVSSSLLTALAWRLWRANPASAARAAGGWAMAAFQFVNPKAWMLMTSATGFLPKHAPLPEAAIAAISVGGIGVCTALMWISLGAYLGGGLTNPARRRMFNRASAILIMALIPFLWL